MIFSMQWKKVHSHIHLISNWQGCALYIGVALGLENFSEEYDQVPVVTYSVVTLRKGLVEYDVCLGRGMWGEEKSLRTGVEE